VRRERPRDLTSRPRVCVVIGCYNYGRFLRACVRSVLAQRGVDLSVVIVDGGSTDDTAQVSAQLAAQDSRVTVVRQEVNDGPVATFNAGLRVAEGDYVVLLAADDLLAVGSLRRAAAALEAHPEAGLVYGGLWSFQTRPPLRPLRQRPWAWTCYGGREWLGLVARSGGLAIFSAEAMYRASLVRELAGYDARLAHTYDLHLHLRVAARSDVIYINGCDQAYGRYHRESLTAGDSMERRYTERLQAFEVLFDDDKTEENEELLRTASEAVAGQALEQAVRLRDAGEVAQAQALARFAQDRWPDIRQSASWLAYQRGAGRTSPPRRTASVTAAVGARLRQYARWLLLSTLPPGLALRPGLRRFLVSGLPR